jgi:RHS repeat-associated protein
LCEQRDQTGGTVTRRFFSGGEQISGTNYLFTRDHLGSIREMMDASGTIQARYDYDPYGRRTKVSGNLDSDFGFTGHCYHPVSGLHLPLYRAYDTDIGGWLSRDPIGEMVGPNLHAYASNNPINFFDRYGLQESCKEKTKDFAEKAKDVQDAVEKYNSLVDFVDNYDALQQQRMAADATMDAGAGATPAEAGFAVAGSPAIDPQAN